MSAVAALALAAVLGPMAAAQPDGLPAPTNALLSMAADAKGVQVYRCEAAGGGYGWRLVGPDAILYDSGGRRAGRHFAGPTWEATDGSRVTGRVIAKAPSPSGRNLDWLLLRATPSGPQGVLSGVDYVKRVKTSGGLPPAATCAASDAGRTWRQPYTAEYDFYTPVPPPSLQDKTRSSNGTPG